MSSASLSFQKRLYLGALAAFAPMSTDIYLPAMPTIKQVYGASTFQIQLTLSIFFIFYAFCQLIWGPWSDRVGRKPIIFLGLGLFVLGSEWCAFSQTINEFITARALQAIGACSGIVMTLAIIKDVCPEQAHRGKVLSKVLSLIILAPMIAPIIGSFLLVHIGWQASFHFLSLYALIMLVCSYSFNETHDPSQQPPLTINNLLVANWQQFKYKPFLFANLGSSFNFSILFAFIASSSMICISIFKLTPSEFSLIFMINAACMIAGSRAFALFSNYCREITLIRWGCITMSATSCVMWLLLSHESHPSLYALTIPMGVVTFSVGCLYPALINQALRHVLEYNGLASSLLGTTRFIVASVTGLLVGVWISHSPMPLAPIMLCLSLLTAISVKQYQSILSSGHD